MDSTEGINKGLLIVISGPSGVGKGSILKKVVGRRKNLKLSVSYTTRNQREGEIEGKDYHFLNEIKFLEMACKGEMLEYAKYCGNYYGTPLKDLNEELNKGNNVILEIEVQGGEQVINKFSDVISIFVLPPSLKELSKRLSERASDSKEVIFQRIAKSKQEINLSKEYKYVVINEYIDECASQILKIIDAETLKFPRMKTKIEEIFKNE